MDILNPGLLGSREWFDRMFARPIEVEKDEAALERLRAMVQPFILRRAKDEPEVELDLPPITVEKDYCRLTIEQASLYQATVDSWLPRIEEHEDRFGRRGAVLAMLGHLKQVCNHPEMLMHRASRSTAVGQARAAGGAAPGDAGRRQGARLHAVPELRPARAVPRRAARAEGRLLPRAAQCDAARRAADRVRSEEPGGPSVLVISIRAGGRGLNLPAANHVFHFDRWWNPAVEQQATDRAHRLGQHKPVFVHRLICTRHAGGADRRAAGLEARARREGDGRPLGGLARRSRPGRDPCRSRAGAERRGGGSLMGPWSRSFIAAVAGNAERPDLEVRTCASSQA